MNLFIRTDCYFLRELYCLTKGLFLGREGRSFDIVSGFFCNCASVRIIWSCSSYSCLVLSCKNNEFLPSYSILTPKLSKSFSAEVVVFNKSEIVSYSCTISKLAASDTSIFDLRAIQPTTNDFTYSLWYYKSRVAAFYMIWSRRSCLHTLLLRIYFNSYSITVDWHFLIRSGVRCHTCVEVTGR